MASQPARDEFGGILVANQPARDEFGGIPVGARPAEPASKTFGEQLTDIPRGWWNQLSAVGQGMVDLGKAIANPTDPKQGLGAAFHSMSESNLVPLNRAAESFKSGDPVGGMAHSVHYLLNALPGFGTALDEAGEDYKQGNWGKGTGKTLGTATVTLPPDAIGDAALSVARSAATPVRATGAAIKAAAPDLALGTGKVAVGAALTKAGLPPVARELLGWEVGLKPGGKQIVGGLGKGYDAFKQTFADAAEARAARPTVETPPVEGDQGAPEPPAGSPSEPAAATPTATATAAGPSPELLDQIAMDLSGKPFDKLKGNGQAIVRDVAEKYGRSEAAPAQPAAPPAPPPEPPPAPEYTGGIAPGTTVADLIQQELAARRAAAAPAEAPTPAEPQPAAPAPAVAPEPAPEPVQPAAVAPEPVAPPAPAAGPEIQPGMTPADAAAEMRARKQAAAEAKIQTSRAKAADNIAKHLNDAGFTLADIDAQPPEVQEAFWKNAGEAHRKGYKPSADTVDAIRERMGRMEAAKAAPAPAPTPAPAPADVIAETARQLRAAGINAATVAKYTPDLLQRLGVQPFQVKQLLRAMMSDETRPPAAQAAAAGQ